MPPSWRSAFALDLGFDLRLERNVLVPLVKSAVEFMGGINIWQDFYFLNTLDYPTLSVMYPLVLNSLATRWYCEQIKPPEINPFVNDLAEKLKAS